MLENIEWLFSRRGGMCCVPFFGNLSVKVLWKHFLFSCRKDRQVLLSKDVDWRIPGEWLVCRNYLCVACIYTVEQTPFGTQMFWMMVRQLLWRLCSTNSSSPGCLFVPEENRLLNIYWQTLKLNCYSVRYCNQQPSPLAYSVIHDPLKYHLDFCIKTIQTK